MAKRRSNNEGTIYKRLHGKWRAQVTIGGQRLSYTGGTLKECQKWIREIRQQIDNGLTLKGAEIRLDDFLVGWLGTIASSRSRSTVTHYRWIATKRIVPILGKVYLSDLKTEAVQKCYDNLIARGFSRHAVHCAHKVLRISMSHAVKLGYIGRNPCDGTAPPKPFRREMKFLDEAQVRILLTTASKIGDRLFPLYYLAIHTGLRISELMGVKWGDIEFERKTLQVNRQVLHTKGGGFLFTEPKSSSGKRSVVIGEKALAVLKTQCENVKVLRAQANGNWTDLDLVFPSNAGTPLTPSNIRRGFRKVLKVSNVPKIRFHDLRHTAASLMLNHGVPVLIASRRLGHSKASITMDVYGHLMPNKQEEAAELLDDLVSIAPKLHQNK